MILIFYHVDSGELESTLLNTSSCSANLRAILADDEDARRIVCEMADVMDGIDFRDARGFRLASILNPNVPNGTSRFQSTKSIIDEEYIALLRSICGAGARMSTEATFFQEVSIRGVCYAIHESTAYRNSYIQFQLGTTKHGSGRIEQIMKCEYYADGQQFQDTFLIVRRMIPIEVTNDPYQRYNFAGFLAQSDGGPLTVIRLSQVICHCATTQMIDDNFAGLIHMLPVDRVSKSHFCKLTRYSHHSLS